MKKRVFLCIVVFIMVFSLMVAFSQVDPIEAEETKSIEGDQSTEILTLKLGLATAEGNVEVEAAQFFAEKVEEISNGMIKCDVLAGGLAGGEREIVEGQQLGIIDMSVVSGILQNFDPAMMILEYDLLFESEDHLKKVFNGPVGEKIYARLINKVGVRILGMFLRTPRLLTTNKPVNSIEDLSGMKIRVPEMPARVALWKALGASPTPMAFQEVFTGLQTKTIDGQENPIGTIYSSRFHEVCGYIAITNHVYGFMFLNISEDVYGQLTDEQKGWIEDAAAQAVEFNDKLAKESEAELLKMVTAEITTTYPDTSSWRELTKDVYKQFLNVEGFKELYLAIVAERDG